MARKYAAVALLSITLCALPHGAKADFEWDAIQITCLPDLDYFALRTITLEDIKPKNIETAKHLSSQNGVLEPNSLRNAPYKCDLPSRKISVEITNYTAPHYPGECGLSEHFDMLIKLNGEEIHKFSAFGINRCANPESHLVEIDHSNQLRDCTFSTAVGDPEQASCKWLRIK